MIIGESFLKEVGLEGMPAEQKEAFLQQVMEELETRVGEAIGARLTQEQLAEFDEITDDDEAADWLAENVPDFRDTVTDVFLAFKQELGGMREEILA